MELLLQRLNNYHFLKNTIRPDDTKTASFEDGKTVWADIRQASKLLIEYSEEIESLRSENERLTWQLADHRDQQERMEEAAYLGVSTAEEIYSAREELKIAHEKLEAQKEDLRKLSITDPLTGVYNRRYLMDRLSCLEQCPSTNLSFLMIDIDHFKLVNDTYGHDAGDNALKNFTDLCSRIIPDYGIIGRLGGEEFAIILPNTSSITALIIAEDLRLKTEEMQIVEEETGFSITISIGISHTAVEETSIKELISFADKAMYKAKNSGRNRVVAYEV